MDAGDQTFGANPLLNTLVTAVTNARLVDTLNNADALTAFAPTADPVRTSRSAR
jgi:uncharacterized surface protein with fasciclin (FAS1) repeats